MRIDLQNRLHETGDSTRADQPGTRTAAAAGRSSLGEDRAELSADQVRVLSLAKEVNRLPDIRQEKVTALSLAIRQGRYDVSPEQTAEKILAEMETRPAA